MAIAATATTPTRRVAGGIYTKAADVGAAGVGAAGVDRTRPDVRNSPNEHSRLARMDRPS